MKVDGLLMVVDHIGYLVFDIEKSINVFKSLGFSKSGGVITDDVPNENGEARNVYICFLNNGYTCVELVSPINETSDVYSTIKRQGEGPYHICYRISNIESKITELKQDGWMVIKRPSKALAFNDAKVVFLYKKGVGMIELVEME